MSIHLSIYLSIYPPLSVFFPHTFTSSITCSIFFFFYFSLFPSNQPSIHHLHCLSFSCCISSRLIILRSWTKKSWMGSYQYFLFVFMFVGINIPYHHHHSHHHLVPSASFPHHCVSHIEVLCTFNKSSELKHIAPGFMYRGMNETEGVDVCVNVRESEGGKGGTMKENKQGQIEDNIENLDKKWKIR